MATWVNEVTTSQGGNISMKVQGGYGTVSRSGSWVSFSYGTRFTPNPDASSTWTYNSVCAIVGGKNYYAMKNGNNVHTQKNEWIYAMV